MSISFFNSAVARLVAYAPPPYTDREYQNAIAEFEASVKELHEEWKSCCSVRVYLHYS